MAEDVKATYITSPEAARILRITYVGVDQLVRQGKIPAVKIANRWLIPKAFVEELAKTYKGKRGRPRKKKGPPEDILKTLTRPIQPAEAGSVDAGMVSVDKEVTLEAEATPAVNTAAEHLEETPAPTILPVELASTDTRPRPQKAGPPLEPDAALPANTQAGYPGESLAAPIQPVEVVSTDMRLMPKTAEPKLEHDATLAADALAGHQEETPTAIATPSEPSLRNVGAAFEAEGSGRRADESFAVSAEIYHLDSNYDFDLYEKGEITEGARLVVARLKPKIPSLPQFSFRWDYRYEHLNVDIHGVEPAAVDWFRMGENGYSGHLPRRLGGTDPTYEAVIWLPVTFVFRGRLKLVIQKKPQAAEDLASPPPASEGHRKWGRFISPKWGR